MNQSGIIPCEYKCLVLPDVVEETTEGGIVIPDATLQKERNAKVDALLVDVGDLAFEEWGRKPQPGAKVLIAKYSGIMCEGDDGKQYRLVVDKDILAVRQAQ